jgi:methylthioribose-1-phosphate isomerase
MTAADPIPPAVEWARGRVRLVDQRALPAKLRFVRCADVDALVEAIRTLTVRGAPALGIAGAYGVALAARTETDDGAVHTASKRISEARPTAVNLAWGVERALRAWQDGGAAAALATARTIADDEVARNRRMGVNGTALLEADARVLTHCNTGGLACGGYGTALGVIRAAHEAGKRPTVWVDETRPLLQGARLTAWELDRLGIPGRLVADGVAGSLMARGEVDAVIVGADRIAANGDVANKVGTYSLAVLARHHDVPFYVAAPTTTVDLAMPSGTGIPVEQRSPSEVTELAGRAIAPDGFPAHNPAFDVTPADLVTAIVTESGIARPPYTTSLADAVHGTAPFDDFRAT